MDVETGWITGFMPILLAAACQASGYAKSRSSRTFPSLSSVPSLQVISTNTAPLTWQATRTFRPSRCSAEIVGRPHCAVGRGYMYFDVCSGDGLHFARKR